MPREADPGRPSAESVIELRSRVPATAAGTSLLDYLARRFPYHDRDTWRAELRAGRVEVDGANAPAEHVLAAGARLLYRKLHREPPIDDAVRIVFEDACLAVVDKPAHLPVHADGPFLRHTLIHLLRTRHGLGGAHLVHRLDRETSGLLVVAKDRATRRQLEAAFAAGAIGKEYLAVVHGLPPDRFRCDAPIGHAPHSDVALRRSAAPDARDPKPAHTDFVTVERGRERALVRCLPGTGRTHQIRVHLERMGHPLVGDKLYGRPDADYLEFVHAVKAGADPRQETAGMPSRQLLHAAVLRLVHPATGEPVAWTSPLPAEFRRWLLAP